MASKAQMTGMRGVFLVAAELSSRGLIVSPTSRSAFGADLLVTDPMCRKAFSVQVKTNGRKVGFWLLSAKAKEATSRSHIYVLVNLGQKGNEFYVVPSKAIAKNVKKTPKSETRKNDWYSIHRDRIERYRDKWSVFG